MLKRDRSKLNYQNEQDKTNHNRKRKYRFYHDCSDFDTDSESSDDELLWHPKRKSSKRHVETQKAREKYQPHSTTMPNVPVVTSTVRHVRNDRNSQEQESSVISCDTAQPETSEFERKVLQYLQEIKTQVDSTAKLVKEIMKKMDIVTEDEEEESKQLDSYFPIKSVKQLKDVEAMIKSDSTKKLLLIRKLSLIGGKNIKRTVQRVMANILYDVVAKEVNWLGRGDKIAFGALALRDVLKDSIRKHRLCEDATEKEIEDAAKAWLRGSTARWEGKL